MKLPGIDYGPVQDKGAGLGRVADATQRVGAEANRAAQVMQEGLAAYGRELVKTQTQEAAVQLQEGLAQLELEIKASPYVSRQYLREKLGDRYDSLQPHVRAQVDAFSRDPQTGEEDEATARIPTWAVAGDLFNHEAKRLTAAASQRITVGEGWQAEFQGAAAGDIAARRSRVDEAALQATHAYLNAQQKSHIERLANAGAYGDALAALERSDAIDPVERVKVRDHLRAAQEVAPVLSALQTNDIAGLTKAEGDLADPRKFGFTSPEHRAELASKVKHALRDAAVVDWADRIATAATDYRGDIDRDKALDAVGRVQGLDASAMKALREEMDHRIREAHGTVEQRETDMVGRLVQQIETRGGFDRGSPDWIALSDAKRAHVLEKENSARRQQRASSAEERRAQAEANRVALTDFDALPLEERARLSDAGIADRYLGTADKATLNTVRARRNAAQEKVARGEAVKETDVRRSAWAAAEPFFANSSPGVRAAAQRDLSAYVTRRLDADFPDPKHPPTDTDAKKIIADALLYGDGKGGSIWSRDRYKFQVPPGEPFVAFKPEEQKYDANRAAPAVGAPAAAPQPQTAPVAAAAKKPAATRAEIPAALLDRMTADYAAARPGAGAPSDAQLIARYNLGLSRGEW